MSRIEFEIVRRENLAELMRNGGLPALIRRSRSRRRARI